MKNGALILCLMLVVVLSISVSALLAGTGAGPYVVDTLADSPDESIDNDPANGADGLCFAIGGGCTLRAAIMEANANGEPAIISFAVSGTLSYTSGMPAIQVPVEITGPDEGHGIIVLNGSSLSPTNHGLQLSGGTSTVRGVAIVNFPGSGLVLTGDNNHITGSLFGVYQDGVTAGPNENYGILINSVDNLIDNNVISGNNLNGILLSGNANTVTGNFIGTASGGLVAVPNGHAGIEIRSSGNIITNNIISGNGTHGININTLGSTGGIIQGNFIGTDVTGSVALGNQRAGIYAVGNYYNYLIGGETPETRNVISGNGFTTPVYAGIILTGQPTGAVVTGNNIGTNLAGDAAIPNAGGGLAVRTFGAGVTTVTNNLIAGNNQSGLELYGETGSIVQDNHIGVNSAGKAIPNSTSGIFLRRNGNTIGGESEADENVIGHNTQAGIVGTLNIENNVILRNRIFENGSLGIDIATIGAVSNDTPQPFPILSSASIENGKLTVVGEVNGEPNTTLRLHFYKNTTCDQSGYGEGEYYVDSVEVTTNSGGVAAFSLSLESAEGFLTATATNTNITATSEFSKCVTILGDSSPSASNDAYVTDFSTVLTVSAPGVLSNDTDPNDNTLSAALVTSPSHGTVSLNNDGGFIYTPDVGYYGTDSFTYSSYTGNLHSNIATVTITISAPSATDGISNLFVTGNTTHGTIRPTLGFLLPDGSSAEWFNVRIWDANQVELMSQWFKIDPYCDGLICALPLAPDSLPFGLVNGTYHWQVKTWGQVDGMSELSEVGTFEILVSEPAVPENVQVDASIGDVIVIWDDDPVAAWFHIVIKDLAGTTVYEGWHDRTVVDCDGGRCTFKVPVDPTSGAIGNGNYEVTVQAWGAGGFNGGDVASDSTSVEFELQISDVGQFSDNQDHYYLTDTDNGEPTFGWVPAANSSWTQIYIGKNNGDGTYTDHYLGWVQVSDMQCPNGTTEVCFVTPDNVYLSNGVYEWWMVSWGPSGMGVWTKSPLDIVVSADVPSLGIPMTPTDVTLSSDSFSFQWNRVEGITWYQIWLGNSDGTTFYMNWLHAVDVCSSGKCSVAPDNLYLPDGTYIWYMQTYNPAWTGPNWNVDQFGQFTVKRQ